MVVNRKSSRGPLTEAERFMLDGTERFPLASARNLANLSGGDYRRSLDTLDELLLGRELIGEMSIGRIQNKQSRYYRAGRGSAAAQGGPQPKHPRLIAALTTRLELTESVYTVVDNMLALNPGRRILDIQWRFEPAMDAAVRFDDGWMACKWSGIWQRQRWLVKYLDTLHDHLAKWNPRRRTPLPGTICLVASDSWQAEVVRRSVRAGNWGGHYVIHNVATGEAEGDFDLSLSVGKPPRLDMKRWLGEPDRLDRLIRYLMTHDESRALLRTVTIIEQWPGVAKAVLRKLTKLSGKQLHAVLTELVGTGMVWVTPNGGYAPDRDWLSIAARRDRVWSGRPGRLFGRDKIAEYYDGRIAGHEKGLAALVGKLAAAGCEAAPGWRHREDMGRHGQIAPDAMVYIPTGPFGATWHYVEYELNRTSFSGARKKVRPYRSPIRSDNFPLMVVTRRKAVKNYIEASRGMDVMVAAEEDLRRGKVTGDHGTVWTGIDGQPVRKFGTSP